MAWERGRREYIEGCSGKYLPLTVMGSVEVNIQAFRRELVCLRSSVVVGCGCSFWWSSWMFSRDQRVVLVGLKEDREHFYGGERSDVSCR